MKNNNTAVIRKITAALLKSDRKRNVFITAAIFLTTFMVATVFTIGLSAVQTAEKQKMGFVATAAHGALYNPTEEQWEKLSGFSYIESSAKARAIGYVVEDGENEGRETKLVMQSMDGSGFQNMYEPAYSSFTGHYPQKENEVLCPTWYLEELGIEDPEVGMEINLHYALDMKNPQAEIQRGTFILSGFYESYGNLSVSATDILFMTHGYADKHHLGFEENGAVLFRFKDTSAIWEDFDRMKKDLSLTRNQDIQLHSIFAVKESNDMMYLAVAAFALFFMFTGYLLIYNVMHISISRDIRFFGMLKTIGTTPKQLRRIVTGQVLRLCLLGIPLGLLAAAAFSNLLVPAVLGLSGTASVKAAISFSPVIYCCAAVLALCTAFIGALKPAREAARVSPVEALRYSGAKVQKKAVYGAAHGKPWKMALRNIFRERKRAYLMFLSMFLSFASFMIICTVVGAINVDDYIASYIDHDFTLDNATANSLYREEPREVFDDTFLEGIKATGLVTNLEIIGSGSNVYENTEEIANATIESMETDEFDPQKLTEEDKEALRNNEFLALMVIGVDVEMLQKMFPEKTKDMDTEAFDRGECAFITTQQPEFFNELKELTVGQGDTSKKVPVIGTLPNWTFYRRGGSFGPMLVCSNKAISRFAENPVIETINIDVKEGTAPAILEKLEDLSKGDGGIRRTSRIEESERMSDMKNMIFALGGGTSLILGLIGIMNFVNMMSVGILARRRELAILETVGMSRKQTKGMLVFEGLWYAVITLGLAATGGSLLSYCVYLYLKSQADFISFTYPLLPVLGAGFAITVICVLVPRVVYGALNKAVLIDRLREDSM